MNQFGQEVWEKAIPKVGDAIEKIDLKHFQNGLYFLKIQPASSRAIAKKLLINQLY